MSKIAIFKKIYAHIYEKQDYYLKKINIVAVSNSVNSLKEEITTTLNISVDQWQGSQQDLKPFIHALILFNHLLNNEPKESNEPSVLDIVLKCTSQESMVTLFEEGSITRSKADCPNWDDSYFSARACKSLFRIAKLHKINPFKATKENNDNSNKNYESDTNKESSTGNIIKPISLTSSELAKKIEKDKKLSQSFLDMTDDEISNAIQKKFSYDYLLSDDVIDEYLLSRTKSSSVNISENKPISKIAILEESSTEKIKILTNENNELLKKVAALNDENHTLNSQLDNTNKELEKYKIKLPDKSDKDMFSVGLKELNSLLNCNSSQSEITINDDILVRACKYADKHALIQSEQIISQKRDLKSEVIQLIVLAFLHENSLF